jgi:parvulin-like peptidyl-prolyl isomerase
VQQIVFQTKREAEAARRESVGGTDFFAVARRYYPGDTALMRESFDLGFISPPAMPGEFFAVAETLTAGSVSRPVKTEWGYHLIKVLERRPDMTFEFARSEIVNRLQQARREEHRQKWEAELRAGHRIKINNRLLKKIKDPSLEKLSSAGGS